MVHFSPPDKRRPVLLVTRDDAISFLTRVTVAPITSIVGGIPSELLPGRDEGLARPSAASFDNLTTVEKQRLGGIIGRLADHRVAEAFDAIQYAFGFDASSMQP